jgi:hypothetical protein
MAEVTSRGAPLGNPVVREPMIDQIAPTYANEAAFRQRLQHTRCHQILHTQLYTRIDWQSCEKPQWILLRRPRPKRPRVISRRLEPNSRRPSRAFMAFRACGTPQIAINLISTCSPAEGAVALFNSTDCRHLPLAAYREGTRDVGDAELLSWPCAE